jgi:meso-butanediol dehydrogenase/(S,S)-butanediol dehydrogenase/diacetyl reductase
MSDAPVTIITGAGSGIGSAVARALVARGGRVVLAGRRPDPLHQVATELDGLAVPGDAATAEGVERLVAATVERFGRIDGLVLNAGIFHPGTAEELAPEQWEETLRVNLTGPYLLARAAMPWLRETRGSIVAVSSIGGLRSAPGAFAYATSKAGLIAAVKSLAVDHASDGVRVNCVCPGWTRTEMADEEMAVVAAERGITVEQAYALAVSLVPQRRVAEPAEVAAAIAWLLSGEASYVTGAELVVDGGSVLVDAGNVPITMR